MIRIRCGSCKDPEGMGRQERGQDSSLWVCRCGASQVLENRFPHPAIVPRSVNA